MWAEVSLRGRWGWRRGGCTSDLLFGLIFMAGVGVSASGSWGGAGGGHKSDLTIENSFNVGASFFWRE